MQRLAKEITAHYFDKTTARHHAARARKVEIAETLSVLAQTGPEDT
jgi:hypothetical protein